MTDPIAQAAASLAPAPAVTPVQPPSISGLTLVGGVIAGINDDGTLFVNINGSATGVNVYALPIFIPVVGMSIKLMEWGSVILAIGPLAASPSDFGAAFMTGDTKWSFVNSDQPGWWICNGRSTTDQIQPALATALGKSGTFSIPNSIGRFPVHADGVTFILGTNGGASTINSTHLPTSSPWTLNDPHHAHAISSGFILGTGGTGTTGTAGSGSHPDSEVASGTGITLNTNSGGGQKYVPPYIPQYQLIKL